MLVTSNFFNWFQPAWWNFQRLNFAMVAIVATILSSTHVIAAPVVIDGFVTDGTFISPQFVADPSLPGGGSIQNVDQLGLTGEALRITLDVADNILGDQLADGYSFLSRDDSGNVIGNALSVVGILGDPAMGGLVFENGPISSAQIAEFRDGMLSLALSIAGTTSNGRYLGASPSGLFQLKSVTVPSTIQTVGDLVAFLNMADTIMSGSIPVEFFISSGPGQSRISSTDIAFAINSQEELMQTPLPGAAWLFLSGLAGLMMGRRRLSKRSL